MNTETKQGTMAQFLTDAGISMKATRAPANPNMPDANEGMTHWRCTFKRAKNSLAGTDQLPTYFSMGSAHTKPPKAGEVLDCLSFDAVSVVQARGFDDWAGDMGYNLDSRKAFKVWDACRKGARELEAFLGPELYARLLFDTERL